MRLIDAKQIGLADMEIIMCDGSYKKALEMLIDKIANAPTIDAVPVIRCKDCKYKAGTEDGEYNPEDIVCTYWMSDGLNEDDYCSYGERKEE